MGKIWRDIYSLRAFLDKRVGGFFGTYKQLIVASGHFDIFHAGHARYLLNSFRLEPAGRLVVIVNTDEDCIRKKGYVVIPEGERAEIVASVKHVSDVLIWGDGTGNVAGALEILRPDVFTNGGDRDENTTSEAELAACKKIFCQPVFGVGGTNKLTSSTEIIKRAKRLSKEDGVQTI